MPYQIRSCVVLYIILKMGKDKKKYREIEQKKIKKNHFIYIEPPPTTIYEYMYILCLIHNILYSV